MKKFLLVVTVFLFNLSFSQNNKGKLFIIGGGSRPDFLVDRMVKEAGLNPGDAVAIFPQASSEQDSSFYYAKQQFEKRNLKAVNYAFKKGEKLPSSKLDSLKKAKLIYVGGGDQVIFMDIINKFFTETPSIIGMLYIIIGVSALGIFIFHFLPEEKALNWLVTYRGYYSKREEYDWVKTLRKQTIFLSMIFIYSLLTLILTYIFGDTIAKIGLLILAVLALIGSFFLNPVKKS